MNQLMVSFKVKYLSMESRKKLQNIDRDGNQYNIMWSGHVLYYFIINHNNI